MLTNIAIDDLPINRPQIAVRIENPELDVHPPFHDNRRNTAPARANESTVILTAKLLVNLPSKAEATVLVESRVRDEYQRYHALMVATAMEGYSALFDGDPHLWYMTGYLHDLDFDQFPNLHPAESLRWFREWTYPEELIHAVEAHAYGFNGFTTLPNSKLAAALLACDEISGIFYAYRKLNPIRYADMKASSIKKKLKEPSFAAKIDRSTIYLGCERLGVSVDDHIANLIRFFTVLA